MILKILEFSLLLWLQTQNQFDLIPWALNMNKLVLLVVFFGFVSTIIYYYYYISHSNPRLSFEKCHYK